jgi:hypothetical protein
VALEEEQEQVGEAAAADDCGNTQGGPADASILRGGRVDRPGNRAGRG